MNRQLLVSFLSGFLFAVGLAIAGMSAPGNVIGFLDVFGDWKPALAFVMAGAIGVNGLVLLALRKRGRPLLAPKFRLPTARDLDARLIGGAALFGVGWGIGGYCPGPGIIAPWSGAQAGFVFLLSMVAGIWIFGALRRARTPVPAGRRARLET